MVDTRATGRAGEEAAARYLKHQGYKILHQNLHLGKLGELDLVAIHNKTLVFVEVKAKECADQLGGFDNITYNKQQKLISLGNAYLVKHKPKCQGIRFDAVEVVIGDDPKKTEINHIVDAFRS